MTEHITDGEHDDMQHSDDDLCSNETVYRNQREFMSKRYTVAIDPYDKWIVVDQVIYGDMIKHADDAKKHKVAPDAVGNIQFDFIVQAEHFASAMNIGEVEGRGK